MTTKAPLWRRLLALLIDAAVWTLILYPVIQVLLSGEESRIGAMIMNSFTTWVGIIGINLYLLHSRSQTIGKWALNIQIRRADGSQAAFSRKLFLRYLLPIGVFLIPYLGLMVLAVDFVMLLIPGRDTLHDRLAATEVYLYPEADSA
jgi:uncharacterized RDD family membrane protein YckC